MHWVTPLITTANAEDFRTFAWLRPFIQSLGSVTLFASMTAVSSFFAVTWMKIGKASSADARRRLNPAGQWRQLGPDATFHSRALWIVFSQTGVTARGRLDPCILMLALFPITLAYVIVVQRALDVSVVIRQGLRYALAKRAMLVYRRSRFQQSSSALYSSPPIRRAIARAKLRPWHPVLSP